MNGTNGENERIRFRFELEKVLMNLDNSEQAKIKEYLNSIMDICETESLSKEIVALVVLLHKQNILKN